MFKVQKKLTSLLLLFIMVLGSISGHLVTAKAADSRPEGFVYAQGTKFMCDGSPYYYGGTNCYYLIYKSKTEVNNVIEDASDMGIKVIRAWGHLDVGTKTGKTNSQGYQVFENNNDGSGEKDGVYFQYFDSKLKKPVVNEGADGLQRLDYAIAKAEKENVKLLITFTNYWEAFGGMGQYAKWAKEAGISSNLTVDDFYTNETLKGWYKNYIKTLLNHTNPYTGRKLKDEPGVFAWELANEPRCKTDAGCKNDVIYEWAKEMSAYVKSIDPYHMVSVGDEGFYNLPYNSVKESSCSYIWYGAEGVDFEKLMTINTIDFGTPHIYVDQWGMKYTGDGQDDMLWLKKHAETTKANNKPVILEEFGIKDKSLRDSEYTQWYNVIEGNTYDGLEYAGSNYWMIASYLDNGTLYPDYDGYTVYGPAAATETATTRKLIVNHNQVMEKKNIANSVNVTQLNFDRSNPSDIVVKAVMKMGTITGLACNDVEMKQGTDYTVSSDTITIKKEYFSKKELAKYTCKVLTSAGNKPTFTVNVSDSKVANPELSTYAIAIDKNTKVCTDVQVTMKLNGSEFRGIKNGTQALVQGSDYAVDGNTVTIKKSYLTSLATGNVVLTFDFYEGIDRELAVSVTDTTGKDSFDTFDGYTSVDELNTAYSKNSSGNSVGLNLVTKNGSQALAFGYNVGSPNYCGVNKTMKNKDFASFLGIELWIEGDGSGNEVTIQFKDDNDHYWESYIKLDFTGGKTVQLPFSGFKAPSWQSSSSTPNIAAINQFSIYVGSKSSKTTGTIYFDEIIAYKDQVEVTIPYIQNSELEYNIKQPTDLVSDVVFYGTTLKSITYNGTALTQGTDYSINGGQVRINQVFLKTLVEDGVYQLVYTFSDSTTAVLTITVTGSEIVSPVEEIVIDSFDNLISSNYVRNSNGNSITVTSSSGKAKISYTVGNPDYAGITKTFSSAMDWSQGGKVNLDLVNDIAGRNLVIQFRDQSGNYFEARKSLSAGTSTIEIPISEFKTPSWAQSAVADLSKVTEYSIYIEKGSASAGSGTLYMDNLVLVKTDDEPVVSKIVIDSFDNINSSNYRRNESGNAISITSDGERAKVSYTVGNPEYAGFTKAFSSGMNWTTGKTMKLEVTSDTAGRDLVIQFKDKNGNYFEAKKTLSGGSNTVTISLSEFKTPSWAQSATPDYSMITEYSIYIEKGTAIVGTGTLYVDNLILE